VGGYTPSARPENDAFRYFFRLFGISLEHRRAAAYNARELSSRTALPPDHVIERDGPHESPQGKKMDSQDLNRRAFGKLAAAALGGMLVGASVGLAADKAAHKKDPDKPLMSQEPHICRGLNTCKNKGHSKENACAGAGDCSSAKAHTCAGDNDCAGLGGCNAKVDAPGENKCKGMGGCHVPIKNSKVWAKARENFEADMKKADKKFHDAPKAKAKEDK
jgi:hypothetical protein